MDVPMIYCINLKKSVHRKRKMENRLKNHNIYDKAVFVEAVSRDSPLVYYYHQFATPDHHNPDEKSWRTVMACFASHLKAVRTFLESGEDECLICEDDVMFKNRFAEEYSKVRSNMLPGVPLMALSYINSDWKGCEWTGIDPGKYNLCKIDQNSLWGSLLYLMTRDYAIKVMTDYDKPYVNGKYDHCSEVIIKAPGGCIAYPVLAIEESNDSEIHPEHLNYHRHMFDQWGRRNYTDGDK